MKKFGLFTFKIGLVFIIFAVLFIAGSSFAGGKLPQVESEPGLISAGTSLFLMVFIDTALICILILTSRYHGWKLSILLSLAYYGAVTFMMQIETWYFLTDITVSPELLLALFLMRLPLAFLGIPMAVWILGKWKKSTEVQSSNTHAFSAVEWVWRGSLIAIIYVILYFSAGYFIAWQNPELRAFYNAPTVPLPFIQHMIDLIKTDPMIFPFQFLRGWLWMICILPIFRGSKLNVWSTAVLVGAFLSLPQNIGHLSVNPIIPNASVRMSHFFETASSMFVFGLLTVWILNYRKEKNDKVLKSS